MNYRLSFFQGGKLAMFDLHYGPIHGRIVSAEEKDLSDKG